MCNKFCEFYAGLVACFGPFCFGVTLGWAAPSFKFVVTEEDLGYKVTEHQFNLISSALLFGGLVAFLPSGMLAKAVGPRNTICIGILPAAIGWLLFLFGNHYAYAIVARFALGISDAVFVVSSRLYVVHIAETKHRGMLGVLYHLMMICGIVYSFFHGAVINNVFIFNICCAIPSVLLLFLIFTIPESPIFYITIGKNEEALRSFRILRGKNTDISQEFESNLEEIENEKQKSEGKSACQTLMSRQNFKSLLLSIALISFHQLSGISGYTFYLTQLFKNANVSWDPKYVTLIYGLMSIPFVIIAFFLIDITGRKVLLISSAALETFFAIVFGTYFTVNDYFTNIEKFNWIPVVAILLYSGCFQIGMGSVIFIIVAEIFPEDVRSLAVAIASTYYFAIFFAVVTCFVPITEAIGLGPATLIFGLFDFILIIVTICFVPETKGKTFAEIQQSLSK